MLILALLPWCDIRGFPIAAMEIAQYWGREPHPSSLPAHVQPAQSFSWLEKGSGVGGGPYSRTKADRLFMQHWGNHTGV